MSNHKPQPMRDDPIVEEVRKARREYFASCGNDLDRMFDDLQRRQSEHPEMVASFPPKPVAPPTKRRKSA